MPFREKSAWFVLIGLIATFGVFFFAQVHGFIEPGIGDVHWFLMASIAFIALQIALHIIAAALAPKDAGAPVDEREQLIALKAARNAGLTLAVGALMVPLSMHIAAMHNHGEGFHAHYMAFMVMAALVISEMVRAASKIVYYRRG